ncbi:MAG: hypothetical protein KatS3mg131_1889 [Candidatus Tectimicrobiota bacterium]|nr:MAG: hypothetical protein KatS3mg131_1889 [Candidatus Tectomicrobia bacterium]
MADTGNHLLRRVDLQQGTVTTLAGTGAKALAWNVPGAARRTPLNSPWDLFLQGDSLYIAMAGMHQIWRLHLPTGWLEPFAGTGEEGLRDGERSEALLAQPSGLSGDGARLYVADTEANAVRRIGLAPSGEVTTLAGGGLFTFGDRDGSGREARLQHPLGLAYADGRLYVADTYNYKLKVLDLSRGRLTTLAGSGTSGSRDGAAEQAQFDEPGGLSAAGDRLYVADTNNHRVRVVDLKAGTVRTLALPALAPPAPTLAPAATVIRVAEQALPVATPVILQLRPQLPAGWKLNPEAPATLAVEVRGDAAEVPVAYRQQTLQPLQLPLEVPLQVQRAAARAVVSLALRLVLCQTQAGGICALRQVAWEVPVVGKATATATTVPLAVVLP